jgi:hypothetical protein
MITEKLYIIARGVVKAVCKNGFCTILLKKIWRFVQNENNSAVEHAIFISFCRKFIDKIILLW